MLLDDMRNVCFERRIWKCLNNGTTTPDMLKGGGTHDPAKVQYTKSM